MSIRWTVIVGVVCLTIIQINALNHGINGKFMMITMTIIAGAIGVVVPTPNILKQ